MSDWVARPYDPIDQGFVAQSWLRSFSRSYYAKHRFRCKNPLCRRCCKGPGGPGTCDAMSPYFASHEPIVRRMLDRVTITVLHVPDEPAVILAWAATDGPDVLHYALCKRSVHDEGLAAAAFGALLGDRLGRAQLVTHEQMDLKDERRIVPPDTWVPAPYVLAERAA